MQSIIFLINVPYKGKECGHTAVLEHAVIYLLSFLLQQSFLISSLEGIKRVGVVQRSNSWTATSWGWAITNSKNEINLNTRHLQNVEYFSCLTSSRNSYITNGSTHGFKVIYFHCSYTQICMFKIHFVNMNVIDHRGLFLSL